MRSIIQSEKQCFICRNPHYVELHHIFYGTANRKLSDRYGLTVWLCPYHHRGSAGAHFNPRLDAYLREVAELRFKEEYPYDFRRLFYGDGIEVINDDDGK